MRWLEHFKWKNELG